MKCRHCGAKLPEWANYCDMCGEPCINVENIKNEVSAMGRVLLVTLLIVIAFLVFCVVPLLLMLLV